MDEELQERTPEDFQPERQGNLFTRLVWTFVSPGKVFDDIDSGPSWWQPWIWISVFGIIGVYFFAPIQIALLKLNPGNLSPEKVEQAVEAMGKFYVIGYITAPIAALVQALVVSLVGYIALTVITSEINFKKYFTLFLYSNIIVAVGSVISILLVRQRGVENVHGINDATVSFGLEFLVPAGSKFLRAAASSINVFSIWSYVVIAMGLMHIFRLTNRQAVLAVIPIWLIYLIFAMIAAMFGKAM